MSIFTPSSSLPPFFSHSVWVENLPVNLYLFLHVPGCVCCQTGLCGSNLLFCKIPNLISKSRTYSTEHATSARSVGMHCALLDLKPPELEVSVD